MLSLSDPPVLQGFNSFSNKTISECLARNGLLSIWIEPSLYCNYRCVYCYTYSGSHKDDAVSLEKWLDILAQSFALGTRSVIIVGGEPLIFPHLDKLILEIKRNHAIPVIFTNGTNIDRKRAAFLFENDCSILVKLDSLSHHVQDSLAQAKGSLDTILKALQNLGEFPFNSDATQLRLGVSSVVTSQNYDGIVEIWRYCRENRLFPHIEPVGFEGRAKAHFEHLMISDVDARSLYDRLLAEDETRYGITWNRFSAMPAINCKQLLYSVNVTSKGLVTICNGIPYCIGDLNEVSLREVLNSSTIAKTRNIYQYIKRPTGIELGGCYGCRARAYNLLLDMYAEDPIWQPEACNRGVGEIGRGRGLIAQKLGRERV